MLQENIRIQHNASKNNVLSIQNKLKRNEAEQAKIQQKSILLSKQKNNNQADII